LSAVFDGLIKTHISLWLGDWSSLGALWELVTVAGIFVTSTIEARENREVVTIVIPGAFLHTTNKDYIIM
jgi:hypothetical protein